MSAFVIMIALGAGLLIGSRFESAHNAHERFNSYRVRTNASLSTWLKSTIGVGLEVAALVLVLYVIVVHVR
jgi:hypothetical protein